MKMDGEYTLPTNVENVWNNLNDPLVLKNSIPGCTELIKENDNEFKAIVTLKIGPVSAKFNGEVKLSNIKIHEGYTISGNGKGGAAGFAGGFIGTKAGGQMGGFAGGLVATAVLQQLTTAKEKLEELVKAVTFFSLHVRVIRTARTFGRNPIYIL